MHLNLLQNRSCNFCALFFILILILSSNTSSTSYLYLATLFANFMNFCYTFLECSHQLCICPVIQANIDVKFIVFDSTKIFFLN